MITGWIIDYEEALPGFNQSKAKSSTPVNSTADWEVAPLSSPHRHRIAPA